MPDIAIVIVSWNAKNYLVKCLRSIRRSGSGAAADIIVVDNASEDGSPEAVEQHFPKVKLIRTGANLGFAAANNIGIRASQADYIFLVNSDVELVGDCLATLTDFMETHPDVGLAAPRILNGDRTEQPSCRPLPSVKNSLMRAFALDSLAELCKKSLASSSTADSAQPRHVEVLSGCFWCVRKAALDSVGLLDENFFIYSEDVDWCFRFHKHNWQVVLVPASEAVHYGGASSSNQPLRFYLEMQRAKLQYWRKHHGRVQAWLYLNIQVLHHLLRIPAYLLKMLIPKHSSRQDACYKTKRSLTCLCWLTRHILGTSG